MECKYFGDSGANHKHMRMRKGISKNSKSQNTLGTKNKNRAKNITMTASKAIIIKFTFSLDSGAESSWP